jgi:hypothetical protein
MVKHSLVNVPAGAHWLGWLGALPFLGLALGATAGRKRPAVAGRLGSALLRAAPIDLLTLAVVATLPLGALS